jgi:hypothetical protein
LGTVVDDVAIDRDWSARDIKRRAHRVLAAELVPLIETWPTSAGTWLDALPAETLRTREETTFPTSSTNWPQTRLSGWPPRRFVNRVKHRVPDTLLVTTLRWTLEGLYDIVGDADKIDRSCVDPIRRQVAVAFSLLETEPVASANPVFPTVGDISAMRAEGHPWSRVAPTADLLRHLNEQSLFELAQRLIRPSEMAWRLFHLGVFGEVLWTLQRLGWSLRSIRPLSATTNGPAYEAVDSRGRKWDLWFEAAGVWRYYGRSAPYRIATQGVARSLRPLGTDVLLLSPFDEAVVIECKYSDDPNYIGRSAYLQALAYATETRTHLAHSVTTLVVVPDSVAAAPDTLAETIAGKIGVVPVAAMAAHLSHLA